MPLRQPPGCDPESFFSDQKPIFTNDKCVIRSRNHQQDGHLFPRNTEVQQVKIVRQVCEMDGFSEDERVQLLSNQVLPDFRDGAIVLFLPPRR